MPCDYRILQSPTKEQVKLVLLETVGRSQSVRRTHFSECVVLVSVSTRKHFGKYAVLISVSTRKHFG